MRLVELADANDALTALLIDWPDEDQRPRALRTIGTRMF
jgi:hypothetical protein